MAKPGERTGHLATLVAVISGGLSAAALVWAKQAYGWSLWTFLFVFLVAAFVFFVIGGWIREGMRRERHKQEPD